MNTFFNNYLEQLEMMHAGINQEILKLPQEALDWSPGKEMNSIAVLVTHLTGSERFWIGDGAAGEPSGRDREAEFRVHGLSREALEERLKASERYARQTLSRFALEDLEKPCISPRDKNESTVGWCLMYALQHAAIHLGHIQLTRQLWEQRDSK